MRIETISLLINQSCDVFHYKPKPEQLDNITMAFITALEDKDPTMISNAFKIYLKTGKDFPTPANILDVITGRKQTTKFSYPEFEREPDRVPPTPEESAAVAKMLDPILRPWKCEQDDTESEL